MGEMPAYFAGQDGGAVAGHRGHLHDPADASKLMVLMARVSGSQDHQPSARDARRRILDFFREHLTN